MKYFFQTDSLHNIVYVFLYIWTACLSLDTNDICIKDKIYLSSYIHFSINESLCDVEAQHNFTL